MAVDLNFIGPYKPGCGISTYMANQIMAVKLGFPAEVNSTSVYRIVNRSEKKPQDLLLDSILEQYTIYQDSPETYKRTALRIGMMATERLIPQLVIDHHEFGLDGENAHGKNYITMLNILKASGVPIITYPHTIISNPNSHQMEVIQKIGDLSSLLIVHTNHSKKILEEVYGINPIILKHIDHGIREYDRESYKRDKVRQEMNIPLNMFLNAQYGLKSPNKGDPYFIEAWGLAVNEMDDEERRNSCSIRAGDYHDSLDKKVVEEEKKKSINVIKKYHLRIGRIDSLKNITPELLEEKDYLIYEKFVPEEELKILHAIPNDETFPYTNRDQDSSGAFTDAMGGGQAVVIATKFPYAEEFINDESGSESGLIRGKRGYLIDFKGKPDKYGLIAPDVEQIAEAQLELMRTPELGKPMIESMRERTKEMLWSTTTSKLMDLALKIH